MSNIDDLNNIREKILRIKLKSRQFSGRISEFLPEDVQVHHHADRPAAAATVSSTPIRRTGTRVRLESAEAPST
jgi:hypothetical protein